MNYLYNLLSPKYWIDVGFLSICKAVGPDDFPYWILKDFSNILSLPLCSVFNTSIEEACLPRTWKSVDVVPSPKTVPVKDAAIDLRQISLTPVMSKIGESFIYKWLLKIE